MRSWTPKPTRNCMSRYLVVSEEMMMPQPRPRRPMMNSRTGVRRQMPAQSGWMAAPENPVIHEEADEEEELDDKLDQIRHRDGERGDEPREIDLAEDAGVGRESGGGLVQAGGEVVPGGGAGQVEQHRRQPTGGNLRHAAEDHREDQGGKQRLDEEPEGSEDRLLVDRDKIATDEHPEQVTIAPKLVEMEIEPAILRPDDEVPSFFVRRTQLPVRSDRGGWRGRLSLGEAGDRSGSFCRQRFQSLQSSQCCATGVSRYQGHAETMQGPSGGRHSGLRRGRFREHHGLCDTRAPKLSAPSPVAHAPLAGLPTNPITSTGR